MNIEATIEDLDYNQSLVFTPVISNVVFHKDRVVMAKGGYTLDEIKRLIAKGEAMKEEFYSVQKQCENNPLEWYHQVIRKLVDINLLFNKLDYESKYFIGKELADFQDSIANWRIDMENDLLVFDQLYFIKAQSLQEKVESTIEKLYKG